MGHKCLTYRYTVLCLLSSAMVLLSSIRMERTTRSTATKGQGGREREREAFISMEILLLRFQVK
jgi:hypothetical protein